jgi:hypothetical protein
VPISSKWSLLFRFSYQNFVHISKKRKISCEVYTSLRRDFHRKHVHLNSYILYIIKIYEISHLMIWRKNKLWLSCFKVCVSEVYKITDVFGKYEYSNSDYTLLHLFLSSWADWRLNTLCIWEV